MTRRITRTLLLAVLVVMTIGLVACESTGTSTVYVGVHSGYGYGPGWGGWHGGGYYPGYPVGPGF